MSIEANITIDATEDVDLQRIVTLIEQAISRLNGQNTQVNVVEIDNPTSFSPLALKRMRDQWQ